MLSKKTILKIAVPAISLLAAVIGGGVYLNSHNGNGGNNSLSGGSNGNCVFGGNAPITNANCKADPQSSPDYRVNVAPIGTGPWQYRVVNTVVDGTDEGLLVRTCDHLSCGCSTAGCEKIGLARGGTALYAMCQEKSDFNGNDNSDSYWLEVRWPSNTPDDVTVRTSAPDDSYTGWVLRKYTTPAGHNGNIPTCA